jgi:hypothetical protein
MRKINEIIIHCTATSEGRHVTVADVDNWHRARKFNGIGYHYLIYLDGSIHQEGPSRGLVHTANRVAITAIASVCAMSVVLLRMARLPRIRALLSRRKLWQNS